MQEVRFYALTLVESSVRVVLFCFLRLHCGYPVPHKFVLTRKLIWFVHTSLGRQIFSGDRITNYNYFSWQKPTDTDPAWVITVDCARGFGSYTGWIFGTGCAVSVVFLRLHCDLSSTALICADERKLIIARNGGHFTPVINCQRHLIFKMADKYYRTQENVFPAIF